MYIIIGKLISCDVLCMFKESVIEVSNGSHSLYTTVSGDQCQGQNTISINGLFAEKQCIKNNDEVRVQC